MEWVFFWLALVFGGAVTLAAVGLGVTALFRRRERWVLGGFAAGLVVLAWLPLAALFALMFAMGARPAGPTSTTVTPSPVTAPAGPATAPSPAPGPGR